MAERGPQVRNMMNSEPNNSIVGEFTHGQGLAVGAVACLISFAFAYFVDGGRARTALVSSGAILANIKIFWPLRKRVWFWAAMGCITVAHVLAIINIPLSGESYSGVRIAPIIAIDIFVIASLVTILSKVMTNRAPG